MRKHLNEQKSIDVRELQIRYGIGEWNWIRAMASIFQSSIIGMQKALLQQGLVLGGKCAFAVEGRKHRALRKMKI